MKSVGFGKSVNEGVQSLLDGKFSFKSEMASQFVFEDAQENRIQLLYKKTAMITFYSIKKVRSLRDSNLPGHQQCCISGRPCSCKCR